MDAIVVSRNELAIVSVGEVGPPGPVGPAGNGTFVATAAQALSGHRVLRAASPDTVDYADSATVAQANSVVGLSTGAASAGAPVTVQYAGPLVEPSWNWTPNLPVFCGLLGALTQTAPTAGFSLVVGIAMDATSILVGVKQPTVLS